LVLVPIAIGRDKNRGIKVKKGLRSFGSSDDFRNRISKWLKLNLGF